jgi:diaminohydroxyphosphoribosylaminopyrimidine deaminase/5-amino-6-(5-phosphoribosylamino)uracil reductase
MAEALRLAAMGRYTARPNPMVGCVLVRDGQRLGAGWHAKSGEAHAEVRALSDAGDARGATAYVTLEPCTHHGRTPPCAEALIAAGIAEVVIAVQDPFAAVDGRGIQALQKAGIKVRTGLMQDQAAHLNRGFFRRVQTGIPFVTLKTAISLDGATAMKSGESQWITGAAARKDVQRLRAASGAVLSGIGTVLADDPSLTVRDESIKPRPEQPLRAIVDSQLRMPQSANMLCLAGTTVIYCLDDTRRDVLATGSTEVVRTSACGERVALGAVLADLGARGINDVLVEAGPTLAGGFVERGLVDELVIYQAPHIMGSETIPMFRTPGWTSLAGRRELTIVDVRRLGADTRITARFASKSGRDSGA